MCYTECCIGLFPYLIRPYNKLVSYTIQRFRSTLTGIDRARVAGGRKRRLNSRYCAPFDRTFDGFDLSVKDVMTVCAASTSSIQDRSTVEHWEFSSCSISPDTSSKGSVSSYSQPHPDNWDVALPGSTSNGSGDSGRQIATPGKINK